MSLVIAGLDALKRITPTTELMVDMISAIMQPKKKDMDLNQLLEAERQEKEKEAMRAQKKIEQDKKDQWIDLVKAKLTILREEMV